MKLIIFRVDAYLDIGVGHFMRCLALASALDRSKFKSIFLINTDQVDNVLELLKPIQASCFFLTDAERFSVLKLEHFLKKKRRIDLIIVDGYLFPEEYLRKICSYDFLTMQLDDTGDAYHKFDFVLNQNLGAEKLYTSGTSKLLIGPEYLLLREEFKKNFGPANLRQKQVEKILITFGGSEQSERINILLSVLDQYEKRTLQVVILLGGSKKDNILNVKNINVKFINFSNTLVKYFLEADLVISPSGSTIWELCKVNRPFLTFHLAKNQKIISDCVTKMNLGTVVNLDNMQDLKHNIFEILDQHTNFKAQLAQQGKYFKDAGLDTEKFEKVIFGRRVRNVYKRVNKYKN